MFPKYCLYLCPETKQIYHMKTVKSILLIALAVMMASCCACRKGKMLRQVGAGNFDPCHRNAPFPDFGRKYEDG